MEIKLEAIKNHSKFHPLDSDLFPSIYGNIYLNLNEKVIPDANPNEEPLEGVTVAGSAIDIIEMVITSIKRNSREYWWPMEYDICFYAEPLNKKDIKFEITVGFDGKPMRREIVQINKFVEVFRTANSELLKQIMGKYEEAPEYEIMMDSKLKELEELTKHI